MEFGWIIWVALLVAWTLVGFVVAYIFGGFVRRAEALEEGPAVAPKVSYLRRQKRAHKPLRSSTEAKARRAGGRSHR
jgi:hypothetical protein